jgi:chemotaxis protein methyltransferase CheR
MSVTEDLSDFEELKNNENIEIALLLDAIYLKYGYDFRNYSRVHIKRRIISRLRRSDLKSISEMQFHVLSSKEFFHSLLVDLSLNVTEMFRDPKFFMALRINIIPYLKTYPFIKIWHAGCATGEEVYSMAILLKEEGLYERSIIYATDFNQIAINKATEAIYPVKYLKQFSENYQKSGGKGSLSDHFIVNYDAAILNNKLKSNIVFSDHNLVTDGVFGEMNIIICRNVLIYFNRELQNRVFKLFYDSLMPGGILCLGTKETMMFSEYSDRYTQLHKLNIFKKKYE